MEVKNQSILKMPTDSIPKVDKFGRVNIKVRIEEVSKNHQKQAFVIKIAPDTLYNMENADISPDISSSITVLSKRNKRRPKRDGLDDDSPEGPTPVQGMPYAGGMFALPAAASASTLPPALVYPKVLAAVPTMNSALASANSSVLPTITPSGGVAKPHTLASTSLSGANMTRISSADGSAHGLTDSAAASSPTFADTISHLVNWAQHVYDMLGKIEWQHVGFEVQDDGQMNLHRPLYRCPGYGAHNREWRQRGWWFVCRDELILRVVLLFFVFHFLCRSVVGPTRIRFVRPVTRIPVRSVSFPPLIVPMFMSTSVTYLVWRLQPSVDRMRTHSCRHHRIRSRANRVNSHHRTHSLRHTRRTMPVAFSSHTPTRSSDSCIARHHRASDSRAVCRVKTVSPVRPASHTQTASRELAFHYHISRVSLECRRAYHPCRCRHPHRRRPQPDHRRPNSTRMSQH